MKTPPFVERHNVNCPSISFNSCQKRPLKRDLKPIFHLTTTVVGRDKETDRETERESEIQEETANQKERKTVKG